jgi:type I restriction enzyme, S subunit
MINNWQTKKLGEVSEVFGGGTTKTAITEYWDGKIVWVTPKDLGKLSSYKILSSEKSISGVGLKKSSAKLLPKGTIILSSRAPIGHLAIAGVGLATNQGCRSFICGKTILNMFLYYFLFANKEYLNSIGEGSTFKEVSGSKLKEVKIPLPPLPEQRRIVKILDEVFADVAMAKENAEKNLQNSKELFESYLQNVFVYPGKNWEIKKLKDIGRTQTGLTPSTSNKKFFGNFISFIKPADIDISGNGDIRYDNKGLSESGLKVGRRIVKNSILMVCIGASIGKVGFATQEVSCNQQINTLSPNTNHDAKMFYYILRSKNFFEKIINNSSQATLPIINKSKWENLSVSYPKSLSEQKSIVAKLDALSVETKKLEAIYKSKIADLEELKKSVLRKAFSGEL